MNPRLFTFAAGSQGTWRIVLNKSVVGAPLEPAERLEYFTGEAPAGTASVWQLQGVTSNERYVTRPEKLQLLAAQEPLGRPTATCGALIPIRKNADWWGLTQDERRKIFEETSKHIQIGMKFLPGVARKLHHCRDLSSAQPFDFLTWFDYAPEMRGPFEELVRQLRATEEWKYVDREVDIRVEK
jgi:hypothetical protein